MADGSKIEWTDATWNPITGCSILSPGCIHCYAMKLAGTRMKHHPSRVGLTTDTKAGPVWNGKVRFNEQWLDQPLRWKTPRRIFVCAHGDLFHEDVPDEWIDRVFAVMALCPHHTFQVLTKRADRMRDYVEPAFDRILDVMFRLHNIEGWPSAKQQCEQRGLNFDQPTCAEDWYPLHNVWLGVSCENQEWADKRVPLLLGTPAAVRWVSAEPLIGPIDFTNLCTGHYFVDSLRGIRWHDASYSDRPSLSQKYAPGLDWIVAGGESGASARPMHPDWARSIRDQCAAAGVAFHFKQWGQWAPSSLIPDSLRFEQATVTPDGRVREWEAEYPVARLTHPQMRAMVCVGKKRAGRTLDGATHDAYPEAR